MGEEEVGGQTDTVGGQTAGRALISAENQRRESSASGKLKGKFEVTGQEGTLTLTQLGHVHAHV